MRRRLLLSSGCALALPSLAWAQPAPASGRTATLGLLAAYPVPAAELQAARDDLARLGWRDGVNLRFVHRAHDRRSEQLDAAVADLLAARPDVVIVAHDALARAAQLRDDRVPIVIMFGADPVGNGLAASLQRPGQETTVVTMYADIRPKLFETARQLAPKARRIARMFPLAGWRRRAVEAVLERGRQLARQVDAEYVPVPVRDVGEIETLVTSLQPVSDHVLLVNLDAVLGPNFPGASPPRRAPRGWLRGRRACSYREASPATASISTSTAGARWPRPTRCCAARRRATFRSSSRR